MKLNSKGQVTIPASRRAKHGLYEGDEVEVIEDGSTLRIVRTESSLTRGQRLVEHMRRKGTARETQGMTTDQLMDLLRGD